MDTPQVLLEHYLKQLKLPTMLREYTKLAEQCAKEGVDFQRFLLRLVEAEMVERDQRATERRIKAAKFPVVKSVVPVAMNFIAQQIDRPPLLVRDLSANRVPTAVQAAGDFQTCRCGGLGDQVHHRRIVG